MGAGDLDRRITIQRLSPGRDALNNQVESWTDVATVWASKFDIGDTERVAAKEVGSEITTRFQIRWSSDVAGVTPKDRILCGLRTYGIVGVKELGRQKLLELSAIARSD